MLSSTITNGSDVYTYQWQSSSDEINWNDIVPGGNNSTYNVTATAAGTTYYRLIVMDLSNGCNDPVSNTVNIVVEEQPAISISFDTDLVCIGGISNLTSSTTNGTGVFEYQWQLSPNGDDTWSDIALNADGPNYVVPTDVAGTYYYRVLLTDLSNGCTDPISNVLQITVQPQPTVTISVNNPIVCIGGSSLLSSVILNGSGIVNYQWQFSPDGSGSWANVASGGNGSTYSAPTDVAGTIYYRVIVTDLSSGCTDPVSNVISVIVQPQATVTISVDNDLVCVGGSSLIT